MDITSLNPLLQTKPSADRLSNEGGISTQDEGTAEPTVSTTESTADEFNTFLELLTAQIRNQDPLAPLDSTQFVEQLATFSNLELQAKNTQILESIAAMMAQQLALSSNGEAASNS